MTPVIFAAFFAADSVMLENIVYLSFTKYYFHYAGEHWWFENEQDALMFTLQWGEYIG